VTVTHLLTERVSIHAPAWGATAAACARVSRAAVSIHAPAWGATLRTQTAPFATVDVSIHAPAWGATAPLRVFSQLDAVSIHAPAWGATWPHFARVRVHIEFQSTRPRGARLDITILSNSDIKFQSTRPRGARPKSFFHIAPSRIVSIHAPAWGAT